MGHFARLENNVVRQVVVVNNDTLENKEFPESENVGVSFCQSLFGNDTTWKQTSYNSNFRGRFAGAGMTYDPVKDEFVLPSAE